MERLTRRTPDGVEVSDPAAALERLAQLEDLAEALLAERGQLAQELDTLRVQGKTKTVRFQELLARKMTNREMLSRFGISV
ncbi:MAG: hypothetical protein Q3Y08_07810 [Butyricicoccus sp.]|nr:hypothetical protein [Butyricicoccus sp.]